MGPLSLCINTSESVHNRCAWRSPRSGQQSGLDSFDIPLSKQHADFLAREFRTDLRDPIRQGQPGPVPRYLAIERSAQNTPVLLRPCPGILAEIVRPVTTPSSSTCLFRERYRPCGPPAASVASRLRSCRPHGNKAAARDQTAVSPATSHCRNPWRGVAAVFDEFEPAESRGSLIGRWCIDHKNMVRNTMLRRRSVCSVRNPTLWKAHPNAINLATTT